MHKSCVRLLAMVVTACCGIACFGQEAPFVHHENLVYGEAHGVGLLMDVFMPTGNRNGIGIVDVVSGAWHSDRSKIRDHQLAQTFQLLCKKGFTVFAIRPGSITKFSAPEMITNLNDGIRWVKKHAKAYEIDPDRLGMMGASAGGHLASLAAITADNVAERSKNTTVKAVAVFFPPTDFLDFGGVKIDARAEDRWGEMVRRLAFPQGVGADTDEEIEEKLTKISPARLVNAQAPPFLIIHGDADPLVPLQQSERLTASLKQAGVPVELIVKKGGAHPWPTIHEEVQVIADWFDKQLVVK
ncbi:MAG: prolyl oligopeptidase family serine peptidase [Planctomycetaceae bacterium]